MSDISITSIGHITTQRRVHAEFHTDRAGTDAFLEHLRETVTAAEHLPEFATVQVYVDGRWRTPSAMLIEHSEQSDLGDQAADTSAGVEA